VRTSRPAVFIDRDGTLNVDKHFLHRREEWEYTTGAVEALRRLRRAGFRIIVVSNQSGIGRGYFSAAEVRRLHDWLRADLRRRKAPLDAVYFCPHAPDRRPPCRCRKPAPGMVDRARRRFGLDLSRSYVVGDKADDAKLALNVGATPLFVLTGHGRREKSRVPAGVRRFRNLAGAARWIARRGAAGR
jgi:D-glycero-D-manno-heptose 1,7-bisphosphate phosphatase